MARQKRTPRADRHQPVHKAAKRPMRAKRSEEGSRSGPRKRPIHADGPQAGRQRLQKVLAAAGVDSRRHCEDLIISGQVAVNGQVVDTLPAFVDPEKDRITVAGRPIRRPQKVYFLLNKPKNVICTSADPRGRRTAVDLVDCPERVFCVGRLDADSTGALLLTNDSELANRLTHPRYEIAKTYEVTLRGRVAGEEIERLKKGVWLSEGKTARAAVKVLHRTDRLTTLQVVIRQGMNRQIRRALARLGHKVKALKRTQIGSITVKGLPLGAYKPLSRRQIDYLRREAGLA